MFFFFFFNDTATTEIYTNLNTLSLHDALPISLGNPMLTGAGLSDYALFAHVFGQERSEEHTSELQSHSETSYAVFCLPKKTRPITANQTTIIFATSNSIITSYINK